MSPGRDLHPRAPLQPWQVLESGYVHRERWLTVRKDHVRLPTGAEISDYFVLEYPAWVNVVAMTPDDRFVLIRQYRHGLGAIHFELPAGVVDPEDAGLAAAAQRELLEETGYAGGEWSEFMTLSANAGTHTNLVHTFLARGVVEVRPPALDGTEQIEVHLFRRKELERLVLSGEVIQALNVAPLLRVLFAEQRR